MNEELREALAGALRGKQWVRKVMGDGYTSLLQADEFDLADAVLPTVLAAIEEQGRRRAAEEIERLADSLTDRVRTWVLNLLRARAAALAPENARPE